MTELIVNIVFIIFCITVTAVLIKSLFSKPIDPITLLDQISVIVYDDVDKGIVVENPDVAFTEDDFDKKNIPKRRGIIIRLKQPNNKKG